MDLLSLIIKTNEVPNWTQIFMLVVLIWTTVFAPRFAYILTKDGTGSLYLCFCPLMMMGVMAYYSYKLFGLSFEIVLFLFAGIGNSLASLTFQYRYVKRRIEDKDKIKTSKLFCDDYDDDEWDIY